MPDTKDDGSSKEREVIIKGMIPLSGGGYVPRREPARADFTKWARRDRWHIEEGAMLILGFEPFGRRFYWPSPPAPGFADIYETMIRSFPVPSNDTPPQCLAWAHEKEYRVPRRLEELVNRFHAKDEGTPQAGAENNDLTPLNRQNDAPDKRRERIIARHQELKAGGNRHPTKTVAEEERISVVRVRQLMKPTRALPKAR